MQQVLQQSALRQNAGPYRVVVERAAADRRARELLLSHLDASQRAQFERSNTFEVVGESGQRYRIDCSSYTVNIAVIGRRQRLCGHLDRSIPAADHFLAQKLMLENDEPAFLRIANRH